VELAKDSNYIAGTLLKQILRMALTWFVHFFSGLEMLQCCGYIQFRHHGVGTGSLSLLSPILKICLQSFSTIFTPNTMGLWYLSKLYVDELEYEMQKPVQNKELGLYRVPIGGKTQNGISLS